VAGGPFEDARPDADAFVRFRQFSGPAS
jgi:hypothetical protein